MIDSRFWSKYVHRGQLPEVDRNTQYQHGEIWSFTFYGQNGAVGLVEMVADGKMGTRFRCYARPDYPNTDWWMAQPSDSSRDEGRHTHGVLVKPADRDVPYSVVALIWQEAYRQQQRKDSNART